MSDAHDDSSGRVGLVGKTLGRYQIKSELGRGGMATVYRAFDPQLGRDVAVKVMHGTFTGRGDIEKRFRREAQAVAAIKHDSIVDIFDFAPGGDGEPGYIVSELIQGPTLRELMNQCQGRLLPEVATLLAARVAGALGAAHGHGIIHRDVKPDNVMIDCRAGATVRVLLTDFGVARILEDDTMTATGSILGSPAYMSPEQARGQDVDKTSDVFSFGGLLFHLVTGRPPFAGKEPLTVIAAILTGETPRPSQIEPHVGPALEAVILRCLRRAPSERFPDGAAVHAALRAIAHELPLGASEDPLRAFFDQRQAFLDDLRPRVAAQAYEGARAAVRRGELTRALGEVNRVFAYQPKHAGAEAVLRRITARRRWGSAVRVAVAALALGAGGVATARWVTARRATATTVATGTSGTTTVTNAGVVTEAAPTTVRPKSPPAPTESPTVATGPAAPIGDATARSTARRPGASRRSAARKTTAAPTSASTATAGLVAAAVPARSEPAVAGAANTPTIAPTTAPPPVSMMGAPHVVPAAAIVPPPTASLVVGASQGFCSPSIDEHPAKMRPTYEGIAAGPHRIFCTLPGGAKHLVGTYDLRPGTRPNLVIVPGPDGLPTLARPQ